MGMFDWITHVPETDCPNCGEPLSGWQSKDGKCQLKSIPYWHVDVFYTSCDNCNEWVEFQKEPPIRTWVPMTDYEINSRERNRNRNVENSEADTTNGTNP